MTAISSKALIGVSENKYKFNDGTELSYKEFADGSGLELYETPFRGYDPQIGKFGQIDAMADEYNNYTPYHYSFNNPILFNDPSGLDPEKGLTEKTAKWIEGVVVKGTVKNKWDYTKWAFFADANRKHDISFITNYLKNEGVGDRGLILFNKAWDASNYRARLNNIKETAWKTEGNIARVVSFFLSGAGLLRAANYGYRAYLLYRELKLDIKLQGMSLQQLQRLVKDHSERFRELFGVNEAGARAKYGKAPDIEIPNGLNRELLKAYRELIERVADPRGTQQERKILLDYIIHL